MAHNRFTISVVILYVLLMIPKAAHAIPAFARQTGTNCNLCHRAYPELNSFGLEFMGSGYLIGDLPPGTRIQDKTLSLLESLPLAVRLHGAIASRPGEREQPDFLLPSHVKLFSGAAISKNVNYYMYFLLAERGEVGGLEDAWINVHDAPIEGLGLQLGQFQVMDLVFPRELRLTWQDYLIYTVPQSDSGFTLSYQRGAILSYGVDPVDVAFGIANGSGLGVAEEGETYPGRHRPRFDADTSKVGFGRVGLGFEALSFGLFGLYGAEGREAVGNRFWRGGPDVDFYMDKLRVFAQLLVGADDNPTFGIRDADPAGTVLRGGFAGASYLLTDRWVLAALYNRVISDRHVVDANLYTANASYYLRRNVKFGVEGTWDAQAESTFHPVTEHEVLAIVDLAY